MTIGHRDMLLTLFAVAEGATGLALVVVPTVLVTLLFGSTPIAPEIPVVARMLGAALLAIAAASWGARNDNRRQVLLGLLVGVTLYNGLATGIFVYSALVLKMVGILLWPATFFHAAISVWCLLVTSRTISDVR